MGAVPDWRERADVRADGQSGQGVDASAQDLAVGRHPVIGEAVPGRKGQRLDPRVEEGEGGGKARHPAVVAAHMQPAPNPAGRDKAPHDRRVMALGRSEQGHPARPFGERTGELVDRGHLRSRGVTLTRLAALGPSPAVRERGVHAEGVGG